MSAPQAGLSRLTTLEFTYSLRDLLGGTSIPVSAVDPDLGVAVSGPPPVDPGSFATIGASLVSTSPRGVGLYDVAAHGATAAAFSSMAKLSSILACVPTGTTDPCLIAAINAFGRRAFRRPLSSEETSALVNLATNVGSQSGNTVLTGLQAAIDAILQWPDFLYRVELGVPSRADGGRLKYTSYEVASRLAATLWLSVPDDTLLDAAGTDALSTRAGIVAQTQRMIADPRARRAFAAPSNRGAQLLVDLVTSDSFRFAVPR